MNTKLPSKLQHEKCSLKKTVNEDTHTLAWYIRPYNHFLCPLNDEPSFEDKELETETRQKRN